MQKIENTLIKQDVKNEFLHKEFVFFALSVSAPCSCLKFKGKLVDLSTYIWYYKYINIF